MYMHFSVFKMNASDLPSTFIELQITSISTFNLRFSHHIMKIDENLRSIFASSQESYEELDKAAAQREKRITVEFSRRFSRDYLYPIQLKMKELENEYLTFISNKNCKIAQSMILRPLVLVILKKLSSSTQVYSQFIKKTRSKVFIKLKEVLNLISHFIEIIKHVVDHRILKNNDLEKLCLMISTYMDSETSEFACTKIRNKTENIQKRRSTPEFVKKSNLKKFSRSKNIKYNVKCECKKFEEIHHLNKHPVCDCSTNILEVVHDAELNEVINYDNNFALNHSISEFCSRISELILNELMVEVVKEMNECFTNLAYDAFDVEFES